MKKLILCMFILFTFILNSLVNAQWQQTSGPLGETVTCFAIIEGFLFAGTNGGGIYMTTDGGADWTNVSSGLTNNQIMSLAISGNNLFAGTNGGGVFLSANLGATWTAVNTGLTNPIVFSMAISGNNIYAGTGGGVFLSTDNGTSWTPKVAGLTNPVTTSLAISGSNIFAGTMDGVFLSTNSGAGWASKGLAGEWVWSIHIKDNNIFAGTENGIFLSANNGTSWIDVNSNFISYIRSIISHDNSIFVGSLSNGVNITNNIGGSWSEVNTGLNSNGVNSLTIVDNYIYAGLEMDGVWKRPLSDFLGVEEFIVDKDILLYPDPVTDRLTIEPPCRGILLAELLNLQGQAVETFTFTGQYLASLENLKSGVYILRMTSMEKVFTKKLVKR